LGKDGFADEIAAANPGGFATLDNHYLPDHARRVVLTE